MKSPVINKDTVRSPGIGKALTPPAGKVLSSFTVSPKFVPARSPSKPAPSGGKRGR